MSYMTRLVQQSGLRILAGQVGAQVQGGLPDTPAGAAEGIEEIIVEVPVDAPPSRAADITPMPAVVSPETGVAPAVRPPLMSEAPEATHEGAPAPEVESAAPDVGRVAPQMPEVERTGIKDMKAPPDQEIQRTITRHETLRQVVEWVSPNEMRHGVAKAEPTEQTPVEPSRPVVESTVFVTPETDDGEGPPTREIRIPEDRNESAPAPRAVEVIERTEPSTPERALKLEPVEERVDISIGAINVTVEAPAQPAPAPVSAVPAPPPAVAQLPIPRRAMLPTSDRLRRRFIRT